MGEAATLSGKTAVVTGSASGIGRSIALRLAADGAHVLVHTRQNQNGADEVAQQVREFGVQSTVVLADLANADQRDRLETEAWNWRGSVDILINNAGADTLTGEA